LWVNGACAVIRVYANILTMMGFGKYNLFGFYKCIIGNRFVSWLLIIILLLALVIDAFSSPVLLAFSASGVAPLSGPTIGETLIAIAGDEFMVPAFDGTVADFGFLNGVAQTYVAPQVGKYKVEVWGAQGGGSNGGKGGYAVGTINLAAGETIAVSVGGQGSRGAGGYNGGGGGGSAGQVNIRGFGGGGATDVRVGGTGFDKRVIVAGGGGGGSGGYYYTSSASGGTVTEVNTGVAGGASGLAGVSGYYSGGGQSGTATGIGLGGARMEPPTNTNDRYNCYAGGGGGGGGGYYGGGGGAGSSIAGADAYKAYGGAGAYAVDAVGGNGGSGASTTRCYGYSFASSGGGGGSYYMGGVSSGNGVTKAAYNGNVSFPAVSGGNETGHEGNGYARITPLATFGKVTIDGKICKIESWTDTEITCWTPPHAQGTFDVVVDNTVATTVVGGGFTYLPITIGNITPSEGPVTGETTVVIEAENFAAPTARVVKTWNYGYTGATQNFTAPDNGYYQMEVWGAQGGTVSSSTAGGGGYARGVYYLTAGQVAYLNVGGKPSDYQGGFNGGGASSAASMAGRGGGGATDVRVGGTGADKRVIVAGGGGGQGGGRKYTWSGGTAYSNDGQTGLPADYVLTVGGNSYSNGGAGAAAGSGGAGGAVAAAENKSNDSTDCASGAGGGGGGGYYGGGGASGAGQPATSGKKGSAGGSGSLGQGGAGGAPAATGSCYGTDYYGAGGGGGSNYIGGVSEYLNFDKVAVSGAKAFLSPNNAMETGHQGSGYLRIKQVAMAITVKIDNSPCTVTDTTVNTISCRTAAHPSGTFSVTISNGVDSVTKVNGYTYTDMTVDSVAPRSGPTRGGTVVTISGKYFGAMSGRYAQIGGVDCAVNSWSDTQITCTTGKRVNGRYEIVVNNGAQAVAAGEFEYLPMVVDTITPSFGFSANATVTINGQNLSYVPDIPTKVATQIAASNSSYTIPSNGYYIFEVWGAEGGGVGGAGGNGGYARGVRQATAGQVYYMYAGGQGGQRTAAGTNGGGTGAYGSSNNTTYAGYAGGGASDIRFGGAATSNRILVAGGGGGQGGGYKYTFDGTVYDYPNDGYEGGAAGYVGAGNLSNGGGAATQSSGGSGGAAYTMTKTDSNDSTNCYGGGGGGGGGGYYGGGGGSGSGRWGKTVTNGSAGTAGASATGGNGGAAAAYGACYYTSATGGSGGGGSNHSSGMTNFLVFNSVSLGGRSTFPAPSGVNESGHTGNGYARVSRINYEEVLSVKINGALCAVQTWTDTQIVCTAAAASAGFYDVAINNGVDTLTIEDYSPMVVSAVTPDNGPVEGGTTVVVGGVDFGTDVNLVTVQIGNDKTGWSDCAVGAVSNTQISCVTGAHAFGLMDVKVSGPRGTKVLRNAFEYVDGSDILSAVLDLTDLKLDVEPMGGGLEGKGQVALKVVTNNRSGYTVSMQADEPNLVGSGGSYIAALQKAGDLAVNSWGYFVSGDASAALPSSGVVWRGVGVLPEPIKVSLGKTDSLGEVNVIYFGVKAGWDTEIGEYGTTVILTVEVNS
jgi:hypothetical protein